MIYLQKLNKMDKKSRFIFLNIKHIHKFPRGNIFLINKIQIGMKVREKVIKIEQNDQLLKQQEFSSHQLSQRSQSPFNEQLLSIQKAVFQELLQKNQSLIKQIQRKQKQKILNQQKTYQNKHLLEYLYKIQQQDFIFFTPFYKKAIKDFKKLFLNEIATVWNNMNEQQRYHYENIGLSNYKIAKEFQQEEKITVNNFSGYQMFRIDVLYIVFLCNKKYLRIFNRLVQNLMFPCLIQSLFNIKKAQLTKMAKRFEQFQKYLTFDYKQYFYKYVELLYLMKIAYRLVNYARRNGRNSRNILKNTPLAQINLNKSRQQLQNRNQDTLKLNFCQIAFYRTINKVGKQLKPFIQFLIKQKFQRSDISTQEDKKKLLIKISQQEKMPLSFLASVASQIKTEQTDQSKKKQMKFQKMLEKCKWVFLKGFYSLQQGINTVLKQKIITENAAHWSKNRFSILSILCKFAMERFSLLPRIFEAQEKLEPKTSIYVYHFCYTSTDISKGWATQQTDFQQQILDQRCTLIILVVNSQIIAYSIYRKSINYEMYVSLIKLCIKNVVIKRMKQFNLVLYDFDYERTFDWKTFNKFRIFMKKKYGSNVYILNDPMLFQPHFIIDSFLKCFFVRFSRLDSKDFYLFIQVSICKLLSRIDNFEQKTIEEHFNYLEKIMNLQIGVKEVWRCFRLERGNKYQALILGKQDSQEENCQRPKFIQLNTKNSLIQQLLASVRQCQPNLNDFLQFLERHRWRNIQPTSDQLKNYMENNIQVFLKTHHMKERDIKRILKDSARHLLVYQIYFEDIMNKLKEKQQNDKPWDQIQYLTTFYLTENQNIGSLYPYPQQQAIINNLILNYQKGGKKDQPYTKQPNQLSKQIYKKIIETQMISMVKQ